MILDRSPKKEPLIPIRITRIHLEMFRIKQRIDWIKTRAHDIDLSGNADHNVVNTLLHKILVEEVLSRRSLGRK